VSDFTIELLHKNCVLFLDFLEFFLVPIKEFLIIYCLLACIKRKEDFTSVLNQYESKKFYKNISLYIRRFLKYLSREDKFI